MFFSFFLDPLVFSRAVDSQDGLALQFASSEWRGDWEMVVTAVAQNGKALQYASSALQNNSQVVLAAISQHADAFRSASEELLANDDFLSSARQESVSIDQDFVVVNVILLSGRSCMVAASRHDSTKDLFFRVLSEN